MCLWEGLTPVPLQHTLPLPDRMVVQPLSRSIPLTPRDRLSLQRTTAVMEEAEPQCHQELSRNFI